MIGLLSPVLAVQWEDEGICGAPFAEAVSHSSSHCTARKLAVLPSRLRQVAQLLHIAHVRCLCQHMPPKVEGAPLARRPRVCVCNNQPG